MQVLTFHLGEESYAVDIALVREVQSFATATRVPRSDQHVRGVINLRGHVIPVMDLQIKLGMPPTRITKECCVIILEIPHADGRSIIGALVDGVNEVIELDESRIDPPPKNRNTTEANALRGMGRYRDQFVLLIDCCRTFGFQPTSAEESPAPSEGTPAAPGKAAPPVRKSPANSPPELVIGEEEPSPEPPPPAFLTKTGETEQEAEPLSPPEQNLLPEASPAPQQDDAPLIQESPPSPEETGEQESAPAVPDDETPPPPQQERLARDEESDPSASDAATEQPEANDETAPVSHSSHEDELAAEDLSQEAFDTAAEDLSQEAFDTAAEDLSQEAFDTAAEDLSQEAFDTAAEALAQLESAPTTSRYAPFLTMSSEDLTSELLAALQAISLSSLEEAPAPEEESDPATATETWNRELPEIPNEVESLMGEESIPAEESNRTAGMEALSQALPEIADEVESLMGEESIPAEETNRTAGMEASSQALPEITDEVESHPSEAPIPTEDAPSLAAGMKRSTLEFLEIADGAGAFTGEESPTPAPHEEEPAAMVAALPPKNGTGVFAEEGFDLATDSAPTETAPPSESVFSTQGRDDMPHPHSHPTTFPLSMEEEAMGTLDELFAHLEDGIENLPSPVAKKEGKKKKDGKQAEHPIVAPEPTPEPPVAEEGKKAKKAGKEKPELPIVAPEPTPEPPVAEEGKKAKKAGKEKQELPIVAPEPTPEPPVAEEGKKAKKAGKEKQEPPIVAPAAPAAPQAASATGVAEIDLPCDAAFKAKEKYLETSKVREQSASEAVILGNLDADMAHLIDHLMEPDAHAKLHAHSKWHIQDRRHDKKEKGKGKGKKK